MGNEALLDTSVWVEILERGNARGDITELSGELDIVTSPLVLAEVASLTTRGRIHSSEPAANILQVARAEDLTAEDALAGGELHGRLRREGNDKVGLTDCLLYCTARRIGALYVTFDNDLAGEPGVRVLRVRGRAKRR